MSGPIVLDWMLPSAIRAFSAFKAAAYYTQGRSNVPLCPLFAQSDMT
jgi:hypothetical protein